MIATSRMTTTRGSRMDADRRAAFITGILFVITFVASIPAVLLYDPLLNDHNYILGAGTDARISLGALLEIITAAANIGTAIALYPVLKRRFESLALGYVASRVLESTVIVVGIASVLGVIMLRQDLGGAAGADTASLVMVGRSLVAIHDATFLLGPAFCSSMTGLLLGYMMFRTGLVPRRMAALGLVGGIMAFGTATAVLFGLYEQTSPVSFLVTFPEIVWEAFLGIWLTVKGFNASAVTALTSPTAAPQALAAD